MINLFLEDDAWIVRQWLANPCSLPSDRLSPYLYVPLGCQ